MNQIMSIILVIVMAFSSMAGMTAGIEDAVSFSTNISVDTDALLAVAASNGTEVTEEARQAVKVIGDIVSVVTLKGTATKDAAEVALLAGEDVVLSIGVKNDEQGATVASSLLSSDVIFVSAELIQQMQQQMTQSMASSPLGMDMGALDKDQLAKDCAEAGEKLTQAIEAKKGETETGEFVVDEMTFTAKTPVNMTYTEFVELFLTCVKELAGKESMKPIMQLYKGDDFTAEIDKAIENVKNQPEEDKPNFELTIYTDDNNGVYYVCSMTKEPQQESAHGEKIYLGYGDVENSIRTFVDFETATQQFALVSEAVKEGAMHLNALFNDSSTNLEVEAEKDEAGRLNATITMNRENDKVKVVVASEPTESEGATFLLAMYYNDADKPLITFTGSAGKGGEMVSAFEGENLTVTPIETLMDPNNTTVAGQMQMKLMAGLLKCITVVTKNVPEDTAAWINAQIKQMMSPNPGVVPQGN